MFGILPCFWNQPLPRRFKPIKSLADHHFPPRTVIISRPVPTSVPKPATPQSIPKPVVNTIPPCEMLKPGEEIDTSEIDLMLAEMDSDDNKAQQILSSIQIINQNLDKNIKMLDNSDNINGKNIDREYLLKLLKAFSDYSHSLENYIKEKIPSSF